MIYRKGSLRGAGPSVPSAPIDDEDLPFTVKYFSDTSKRWVVWGRYGTQTGAELARITMQRALMQKPVKSQITETVVRSEFTE